MSATDRIEVWASMLGGPWQRARSHEDVSRAAAKWGIDDLRERARMEAKIIARTGYAAEVRVNGEVVA